tara:strand:- start:1281 stop:2288 length:1008 start_codon:yes stop_codon:yes gene_type:complete
MEIYHINNKNNVSISITNFGLRVLALKVPNKDGDLVDVVLGFDNLYDYEKDSTQYFGSIIGQYANRIENAQFSLNEIDYLLEKNEGNHHIHGGSKGYHKVLWKLVKAEKNKLRFYHLFAEKKGSYPGNTGVYVNYSINDDNEFTIEYEATSDKDTIMNLTNHTYFNLKGEGNGNVSNHFITINSDYYLSTDKESLPVKIESVVNTSLDYRVKKRIGDGLENQCQNLKQSNGFDHCYVLKNTLGNKLNHAAILEEPENGIIMNVFTTEPGMQFYTGNFLDGSVNGKSGKPYPIYSGVCLETQKFPNTPNRPDFPSALLKKNHQYKSTTIYSFSTKK